MKPPEGIISLGAAAAAASILVAAAIRLQQRFRTTPEQQERRRRLRVNQSGRLTSALIVELQDGILHYRYWVGGAEYLAAQDVSQFRDFVPRDAAGPVLVKYLPTNPANSIVICETWSGLHKRKGASAG